jgi:hypothetical protein
MTLPIKVRSNLPEDCTFSSYQLAMIAKALVVEIPEGTKLVQYSDLPPTCTTLPWQQTDGCNPIGLVKHYKEGRWR